MKQVSGFLVILLLACAAAGCAKKGENRPPVRIAINVWPGYAYAFIAQEKGFLKKNNVNIELILKKDYLESKKLYEEGDADGFFGVFADTIFQDLAGIPTKTVYIADYSDSADVLIANPKFNSLAELKGRKIGVEAINSFSHLFVLQLIEKAGLSESDVQFEVVSAQDILTALEQGRIDAGHTWEPVKSIALKKGYKILGKASDVPGCITDILAFNSGITRERPDDILAIVKSMVEARNFISKNMQESLEIMAKREGMSVEEMSAGIKGVYQPGLKENIEGLERSDKPAALYHSWNMIAKFYIARGQITQMPDFDKIVDSGFVSRLRQEEK